jgi:chromosome segregation ATPase
MFSRQYQNGNSFSRTFFAADKASGGGSDVAPTIKQQLETAQARVAELEPLEGKVTKLEGDLKAATENASEIGGDLKAANEKVTALEGDLKVAGEKATKLEGDLKAANEKTEKAESDLKTADERAETKLREIDAKNGGTLPSKQADAGDHTQEKSKADGTPRERLAGIFKIQS